VRQIGARSDRGSDHNPFVCTGDRADGKAFLALQHRTSETRGKYESIQ
jgi:hypothetical protein